MFKRICIIALLLAASMALAEESDRTPLRMQGRMAYDKVIPVLLNAGAGDQQDIARLYWIVFHKQDRQVRADLRMVLVSWPKGKWHVSVGLLGTKDKLQRAKHQVPNPRRWAPGWELLLRSFGVVWILEFGHWIFRFPVVCSLLPSPRGAKLSSLS